MERIDHKEVRSISVWGENVPPDVVHEDKVIQWTDSLYEVALRIAAAGAFRALGSFERVASALLYTDWRVPDGYFDDDEEELDGDPDAMMRRWVEREQVRIRAAVKTLGAELAFRGRLTESLRADGE